MRTANGLRALTLLLSLFVSAQGEAAQVTKVKGKSALIDTEGDIVKPGEIYYVIDLNGARKAVVKIKKVKGSKAIAVIGKGAPKAGMQLQSRDASPSQAAASSYSPSSSSSSGALGGAYWGGILGLGMDSMTADIIDANNIKSGTASTSGMSFSVKGLYDHRLFDRVWFRGLAGVEGFKSEGGNGCGTSRTAVCSVDIMYLSADAIGRYLFSESSFRPWAGGGFSLMFPLSKSSNLLESSSITSTYALIFASGFDWQASPSFYIPVSVEYAMLPKSETVEASWIQVRAGVAFGF